MEPREAERRAFGLETRVSVLSCYYSRRPKPHLSPIIFHLIGQPYPSAPSVKLDVWCSGDIM